MRRVPSSVCVSMCQLVFSIMGLLRQCFIESKSFELAVERWSSVLWIPDLQGNRLFN